MGKAKHEAQNGYYTTIATKISHADKAKLMNIANGFNMTFYELLQALLLALVRYFDTGSLVTYHHNAMINAFANTMFSLNDSYSPLSIKGHDKRSISRAILFVKQEHRQQPQMMAVSKDNSGNLIETYNFDTMLSDFMGAFDNEVLQALQCERKKQGYFSLAHTLHDMILEKVPQQDSMAEEIAEMFTDIRIATGEKINDEVFYPKGWEHGRNGESCIVPLQRKRVLAEL